MNPVKDQHRVWIPGPIYSSDPLEYDLFSHHVVYRSVFAGLLSQYKKGELIGVIAESWALAGDGLTYRFDIRRELKFENGEPIDSEAVRRSLTRLWYVQIQRKSKSGLFEHLVDQESVRSASANSKGITTNGNSIVLKFRHLPNDLLLSLSFGMYSIAHSSQWDPKTGAWLDSKAAVASGPYRVSGMQEDTIHLEIRREFPAFLVHPKPLSRVSITWAPDSKRSSDIVVGASLDRDSANDGFDFYGGNENYTAFVYCLTWRNKDSPCFSIDNRRALRELFYGDLIKNGIKVKRSVLPLILPQVSEALPSVPPPLSIERANLTIGGSIHNSNSALRKSAIALESVGRAVGIQSRYVPLDFRVFDQVVNSNFQDRSMDIAVMHTGILVENPESDIRFMFRSKEGVRLPDPTGKIELLLQREGALDLAAINRQLWEDAIVWPITHFALGLWSAPNYDLSLLNGLLPPTDFSWVGAR